METESVPIPDYPWYTITRDGVIRNVFTHKIIKPSSGKYPGVMLGHNDTNGVQKQSGVQVHRLVAATFVPNPEKKPFVNHLDGDTHNYVVDNLEWCTASENQKHAIKTGLRQKKRRGYQIEALDYLTGISVAHYDSIGSAASAIGINSSSGICLALKDSTLSSGGLRWRHRLAAPSIPEAQEVWQHVPGCDRTMLTYIPYSVSTSGKVRNDLNGNLMTQHVHAGGYRFVCLTVSRGKSSNLLVHRLVAHAFLPMPEGGAHYDVNHQDRNRDNNQLTNLEWLSRQEHAIATHGKRVTQKTLDGQEVATYACYQDAATAVGRSKQSILLAVKGRTSHCAGFLWELAETIIPPAVQQKNSNILTDADVDILLFDILGDSPSTEQNSNDGGLLLTE